MDSNNGVTSVSESPLLHKNYWTETRVGLTWCEWEQFGKPPTYYKWKKACSDTFNYVTMTAMHDTKAIAFVNKITVLCLT